MEKIDRKFRFVAVNPVNKKVYTEDNALILCAHDLAVPTALRAYRDECKRLNANPEHIESVTLLLDRVLQFQLDNATKVPDTVGAEIPMCLGKEGTDFGKEPLYTEKKQLDTEHFFKDYNESNPCGKNGCSVCYPPKGGDKP
jgi:hypothetical protein